MPRKFNQGAYTSPFSSVSEVVIDANDDTKGLKFNLSLLPTGTVAVVTLTAGGLIPGAVAIGDTIIGGTAGRVLFEGAGAALSDDAGLTYVAATDTLTAGFVATKTLTLSGAVASGTDFKIADIQAATGAATNVYGLNVADQTAGATDNFNIWSGVPLSSMSAFVQSAYGGYTGKTAITNNTSNGNGYAPAATIIDEQTNLANFGTALDVAAFASGNGVGTIGIVSNAYVGASAGNTIPSINASYFKLYSKAGGALTTGVSIEIATPDNAGGGAITNNYGLLINNQAGLATNNYSIHTNHAAGANDYAYLGAGTAKAQFGGEIITLSDVTTNNANALIKTGTTLTDFAALQLGTLTNAPTAGDPAKWIAINDNGTVRKIPTWL